MIDSSSLDFPVNVRYVLVDLSTHMTDCASAMLETLISLTSGTIYVSNDIMITDVFDRSLLVFTTTKFAKSLKNLSDSVRVFTLESVDSKIENLIIQLAD